MRSVLLLVVAVAVAGCSSSSSASGETTSDAAADVRADSAGEVLLDVAEAGDAAGAVCTFNRDCPSEQRCACTEAAGCFCQVGPRGTGKSGVDTCKTGNDCESSLCVEGPSSVYYCSGECTGPSDCVGALPKCVDVATLGKICARV